MKKKDTEKAVLTPEWTSLFDTEKVDRAPYTLKLSPAEAVRTAIAKRLGLLSLDSMEVDYVLRRNPGNMVIHVQGEICASATQKCVVSTELMKQKIEAGFDAWYADASQAVSFTRAKRERDLEKDNIEKPVLDESEDPEPIIDGKIDLGELAVQHLSLSINPYPRKEEYAQGQPLAEAMKTVGTGEIYNNPFEALKNWREKESKG